MAKKLKPEGEPEKVEKVVDDSTFRSLTASLVTLKADLSEQTGGYGKKVQTVAETTGLTPQVVSMIVKLKRSEPAKRTAFVSMLITALGKEGFLDEGSLFDSPRQQAKAEIQKAPKTDAEVGAENGKKVAAGIKKSADPVDTDKDFDDATSKKPSRRARSFDEPPAPPLN